MPDTDHEAPDAGRAIWSGTITFGLVSVPVDLFAAVRARQTAMKMVDTKGRPLGRQYYCPKDDKVLAPDDIVRGYETDDGRMVVITDEELASAAPEMSRDIDLKRFVPLEQIPPTYYQRPYILAPSGSSTKAYYLLAQTMQRTGKVGIGTFVMRGNEYLVAILSDGTLLRAETLRFPDELRSAEDIGLPRRKKATAKQEKQAKAFATAIASLERATLDMNELSDRYAQAMHELAEAKEREGKDVVHTTGAEDEEVEASGAEVVDLVNLLRQRLSAKATVTPASEAQPRRRAAKATKTRAPRKRVTTAKPRAPRPRHK